MTLNAEYRICAVHNELTNLARELYTSNNLQDLKELVKRVSPVLRNARKNILFLTFHERRKHNA